MVVAFYSSASAIDGHGIFQEGEITNTDITPTSCFGLEINNLASLYQSMREGSIYFDFHTTENNGGEIRAQVLTLPGGQLARRV